jgi:hypothetical protein
MRLFGTFGVRVGGLTVQVFRSIPGFKKGVGRKESPSFAEGRMSNRQEKKMDEDQGEKKPTGEEEEDHLNRKDWMGLILYFLGGLAVAGFFLFMMMNGPKGVLAGGAVLIVGVLVWIVYRFVFREVD